MCFRKHNKHVAEAAEMYSGTFHVHDAEQRLFLWGLSDPYDGPAASLSSLSYPFYFFIKQSEVETVKVTTDKRLRTN